jgi:hypothetical protein
MMIITEKSNLEIGTRTVFVWIFIDNIFCRARIMETEIVAATNRQMARHS